ncbi:hypothetical protein PROFUN_02055 [Planoprotostelium fungivorum]|uniref:RRM domain-containing protein n=1 Tax=Planoprotostelium fungivorum TaxID=1890364 RepID=A0A2P6NB98_9EUKA|nr:hypothetical protein PROFUN_02055 [Planoprotostelium fungivorum]
MAYYNAYGDPNQQYGQQYAAQGQYMQNPYGMQGGYGYGGYAAPPQPTGPMITSSAEQPGMSNTLWMGDIEDWMEESYIMGLFAQTGEVAHAKLLKNKVHTASNGSLVGYAFVYFNSPAAALRALDTYNNQPIPGLDGRFFRLNWATFGSQNKTNAPGTATVSGQVPPMSKVQNADNLAVFVGDLAADVTDVQLLYHFHVFYPSAYSAKVVYDHATNSSKGFGFVYFKDEGERTRALTEMQGYQLSYRPIKLNVASKRGGGAPAPSAPMAPVQRAQPQAQTDPDNKTIFVYGIDVSITQDILRSSFRDFGEITSIKLFTLKGFAFIDFATHDQAERVLTALPTGAIIGNCTVRLFWGKPAPGSAAPGSGAPQRSGEPPRLGYDQSGAYSPPDGGRQPGYQGYGQEQGEYYQGQGEEQQQQQQQPPQTESGSGAPAQSYETNEAYQYSNEQYRETEESQQGTKREHGEEEKEESTKKQRTDGEEREEETTEVKEEEKPQETREEPKEDVKEADVSVPVETKEEVANTEEEAVKTEEQVKTEEKA